MSVTSVSLSNSYAGDKYMQQLPLEIKYIKLDKLMGKHMYSNSKMATADGACTNAGCETNMSCSGAK